MSDNVDRILRQALDEPPPPDSDDDDHAGCEHYHYHVRANWHDVPALAVALAVGSILATLVMRVIDFWWHMAILLSGRP